MDQLFLIQLITSFIVGGAFIAILSLIAEKANSKLAGIIISLPTTIALGFFFTGWAVSPEAVAEKVVVIPAMEGVMMIFTAVYLYLSKTKIPKLYSMLLCVVGSLLVWGGLTSIIAFLELDNLLVSMIIYLALTIPVYYLVTFKPHVSSNMKPLKYNVSEKIVRVIFGGLIITVVTFLSKTLGPFWGIMFSAFPAVFLSTLTIVYKNYDSNYLFKVWKNTPLASVIFVAYGFAAMYAFPAFGIWVGTLVCYLVSLVVALLISKVPVPN